MLRKLWSLTVSRSFIVLMWLSFVFIFFPWSFFLLPVSLEDLILYLPFILVYLFLLSSQNWCVVFYTKCVTKVCHIKCVILTHLFSFSKTTHLFRWILLNFEEDISVLVGFKNFNLINNKLFVFRSRAQGQLIPIYWKVSKGH